MNVDSIVSYVIFFSMIIAVIYFVNSVYPNFEYAYSLEETKFQKAIAKYKLGNNYEVETKVKCIELPNYFKNSEIEVIGNIVISKVSYVVKGDAIVIINGTQTRTHLVGENTYAYIYGKEICPDLLISKEIHGNKTSYSVTFVEEYVENGIHFEKIYRRWME